MRFDLAQTVNLWQPPYSISTTYISAKNMMKKNPHAYQRCWKYYELNFHLYKLLEDNSCFEKAYNQVQEKADVMEDELKTKFLKYPTPKKILEDYEKVFKWIKLAYIFISPSAEPSASIVTSIPLQNMMRAFLILLIVS